MGVEMLDEKTPFIEGMNIPEIRINLPQGPVQATGIVRSVRRENVLDKIQVGIEFMGGTGSYSDKIIEFILRMDFPAETLIRGA
jgi:hypothetical protein